MSFAALTERLKSGNRLLIAEGYLFEMQRRCYLSGGDFVPDVVLNHPNVVRSLTEEYINAGSDVALAFTYYGHRQKMAVLNLEDDVEKLNRIALGIARDVAKENGCLFAGNVCNNGLADPENPEAMATVREHLEEQVQWAKEEGVDFILGKTFSFPAEALLAADVLQKSGVPFIINMAMSENLTSADGVSITETLHTIEGMGAAAVGLNCHCGPGENLYRILREIRRVCEGPICAIPVPFRTTAEHPKMFQLRLPSGQRAFPDQLDSHLCSLDDIRCFGTMCKEIGIDVAGICCGNIPIFFRTLVESLGRTPAALNKKANMDLHVSREKLRSDKAIGEIQRFLFGEEEEAMEPVQS